MTAEIYQGVATLAVRLSASLLGNGKVVDAVADAIDALEGVHDTYSFAQGNDGLTSEWGTAGIPETGVPFIMVVYLVETNPAFIEIAATAALAAIESLREAQELREAEATGEVIAEVEVDAVTAPLPAGPCTPEAEPAGTVAQSTARVSSPGFIDEAVASLKKRLHQVDLSNNDVEIRMFQVPKFDAPPQKDQSEEFPICPGCGKRHRTFASFDELFAYLVSHN